MDVRMSFQYMLVLSPDEFRVVSKALRGSEMLESENELALELQERMLTMKHAAENIFKDKQVSGESWDVLRRVILHLYYSDKNHPGEWSASADAILRKRGFVLTETEES